MEKFQAEIICDLLIEVYEIETNSGNELTADNLINSINSYLKYHRKNKPEYDKICDGSKLSAIHDLAAILRLCPQFFRIKPPEKTNGPKSSNSGVKLIQNTNSRPVENHLSDSDQLTQGSRETISSPTPSSLHTDRSQDDDFSGFKIPSRTKRTQPLDKTKLPTGKLKEHIDLRKNVKQWLFRLIRKFQPTDKDGGIRMQKVDQLSKEEYGTKDFCELCKRMGYKTVEDFVIHCGAPQFKLAKHKTTGKGKTKQGEWVFQEHDNYPEYEESNEISAEKLLPTLGLRERLPIVTDGDDLFQQFENSSKLQVLCEKQTVKRCHITNIPDSPTFDNFQIRLQEDEKYFEPLTKELQEFYGANGPGKSENSKLYKMLPASLRMGLSVVVWLPKYGEWVRCHTVTPTANQRDFTCLLVDYGHKKNVKVEHCCYMESRFLKWPHLKRECTLLGVKPVFGEYYTDKAWQEACVFMFGGYKEDDEFNIDNPSPNIQLQVHFLEWRDYRAYVEISNVFLTDQYNEQPITLQTWLKQRRHCNLDEEYVHRNDGTSLDDSVSQKRPGKANAQMRVPMHDRTNPEGVGGQARVGANTGGFGRGSSRPGSQIETNNFHQTQKHASQKNQPGRDNLERYKSGLSAKEKTGVDPLSQVSRPLHDAQDVSLPNLSSNLPNQADYPQTFAKSHSRSKTGHRNTPMTTVGPAEALSRGTLTPPAQLTPANRASQQTGRQKSQY